MKIKCLIIGLLRTNCYLLSSGNELIIIDPGGGTEKILTEIKKTKLKLKYIINTHYHPDHTWANKRIKKETEAKILIHKKEEKFINFKADKFLEQGDKIKIGEDILQIIHTPGHSQGSICLVGKNIIFTGDTLFKDGVGRTDIWGGSQEDIEKSLKKLSSILKSGMKIYPGHGESWIYGSI